MYQVKSGYQVENVYQVENLCTNTEFAILTVLKRDSAQRGVLRAISSSLGAEAHKYRG